MISADAIFFDVDGTLVDSKEDIADAINYTLKSLGLKNKPTDLIVSYIGTGVKDLVKKSLGEDNIALAQKAEDIFSRYYPKHSADKSRLYPHVKEVLEYFKYKRKFIITNRYNRFADITLRGLGVREYFEDIFGGDDETCLKPSACVLNRILPKLKLEKDKVVIVGDMAIDVETGKNSGVRACWVTYGLGKAEEVEPLKPDFTIGDMAELKDIVR
ncbi:MAG: HAD-IA family hydrolase [Candidatus Omnitrophota bacterium]